MRNSNVPVACGVHVLASRGCRSLLTKCGCSVQYSKNSAVAGTYNSRSCAQDANHLFVLLVVLASLPYKTECLLPPHSDAPSPGCEVVPSAPMPFDFPFLYLSQMSIKP